MIRVLWESCCGYECAFSHRLGCFFSKVRTWPQWRILYGYSKILGQIHVEIKNPFFVTRMLQNVMIRLWSLWISNRHEMQLIMQSTFCDRDSVLCRAFLKAGLCFIFEEHSLNTPSQMQCPANVKLAVCGYLLLMLISSVLHVMLWWFSRKCARCHYKWFFKFIITNTCLTI